MTRTKIAFIPAASLLLVAGMLAAPAGASSQGRFEPAFTSYGKAEGMFNPIVEALLQDARGMLWIGTHDGLIRFDGTDFKAYRTRPEDPRSLPDDFILALAAADSGRIWTGAQRGGLQLFDPLTEEVHHIPLAELGRWRFDDADGGTDQRVGRTVSEILSLDSGTLLLLTDIGLVRFDPTTGKTEALLAPWNDAGPQKHVTALCRSPGGPALAALSDGSLALVDEVGDLSPLPLELSDSLVAVQPVSDGYLAATALGAVLYLDPDLSAAVEVLRPPPSQDAPVLRDLLALPDGRVWLATTSGAFVGDRASGFVQRVGNGDGARSLPSQEVRDLMVDRTGMLWLGTWNGLASLHPVSAGMARLYTGRDLAGAGVIALAEAADGNTWVGTDGAGLQLLDHQDGRVAGAAVRPATVEALSDATIFGLDDSSRGRLWVAAFERGLWLLEDGSAVRHLPTFGSDGTEVASTSYYVFTDRSGQVWAGTLPLGLLRFDAASMTFRSYRGGSPGDWKLGSDWVWPMDEDSQGRLWVGAFNGGLSAISEDRATATLYQVGPGGLSDDRILTVFVDSRDQVWVGTEGGGLSRLDPESERFTSWTTEDGLPHDNVEGIIEDQRGHLWVATGDGLARMDPASGEILVFREPAGLAGSRFYANAALRDSRGLLYFGGPAGVTIIDPDAITSTGTPPTVALTAFRIQGREVPLARAVRTDELVLKPDENFFAFDFAAMDFGDVSQNRYRYMLEGLDPDWVDAGNTPVANYTSVPPDQYVFRVAARNSEGIWNESALVLPVRVQAHYYETLWFRSLVLLAAFSLVASIYIYRLRQLEARQRLRLEIAGKLHDDIGANLSNIALKAEMVRTAAELDDRRRKVLGDVGRLSRETAHKVRETVWVVNTQYDTLAKLIGHMHDTADTLLAGHVEYAISAPDDVPDRPISMEFRQNVHLLFKEALNNVVKHASASRVDVTVTMDQKVLGFQVADDGTGFDAASAREGNGQKLMQSRAAAVRGHLQVTSAPGAGTVVEFSARLR